MIETVPYLEIVQKLREIARTKSLRERAITDEQKNAIREKARAAQEKLEARRKAATIGVPEDAR